MVVNIIVFLIYAAVLGASVIARCQWRRRDMSITDWMTVIICSAIVLMLMRSAMQIMI